MSHPVPPPDPQQPQQPYGPPQPPHAPSGGQPGQTYTGPQGAQPAYVAQPHPAAQQGFQSQQGQPLAGATLPPQPPRRGPKLWWALAALGVVLALILAGCLAVNALKPAPTATTAPATSAPASTQPATSASATTRSASASTSRSASATPSAAVSAQDYAKQKYGTFEPQTITGDGEKVIPLPAGAKGGLITAKNTANVLGFTLNTQTASGGMGELLFSTEHFQQGTRAFGILISDPATSVHVKSSGAWTITIAPVSSAAVQKPPYAGHGDTVFLYDGPAGTWTFTHNGSENFRVTQAGPGVTNPIVVNQVGRYSGSKPVNAGPLVIEMHGDGDWDIKA